ncbi:MAG: 3-phosphoshikimate 1-carboxyvinyltransferase [Sulfobacillus acidophilus]|uniref:3-phosphoshikimate 1-carboxyvinyltransferase n=1 Tax=Sulfobacillus acidophilus TaxID=53633 RepID=A0A2T2WDS7_9FIRM|nr:MAG: 3-phosphoshikimate 1-carboxyvinyltransferase [Sulfobacillus acidophilus]
MVELTAWQHGFNRQVRVPGDKSLTHRAILFSAVAHGDMEIEGWLDAADTRSSLGLVQALGVQLVESSARRVVLRSSGLLEEPSAVIDCGNSGTTMRLATGLAAGVAGLVVLTGDESLVRRPMQRVIDPLAQLGVTVLSRGGGYAPLALRGGRHRGGQFVLPVASAQVKSALLLAGLSADEAVSVQEPTRSRDHTERMLKVMGASVNVAGLRTTVQPGRLNAIGFDVPGDPSAAAFWCALAAVAPDRVVTVPNLLFNPTRTGFFRVLQRMGSRLKWEEAGQVPEPWGTLTVSGMVQQAIVVEAAEIPAMVDEVPLLALLATQCEGTSVIGGAGELRVKESDRIRVTTEILRTMGAKIEEQPDGWVIEGPTPLHGAAVDGRGDHRMAMLAAVAATVARGHTQLTGEDSVRISYPRFFEQYWALKNGTSSRF